VSSSASTTASTVAVVVVTHNSASQIDRCIEAMLEGCRDVKLSEVIVVDNSSTDDTVARAQSHDELPVRVVQTGANGGFAAGINAGVAAAAPDVDAVIVLNPDITMQPGAMRPLLDALVARGAGITVPKLLDPDGSMAQSLRRTPTVARAAAEALVGGDLAARWGSLGERVGDPAAYTAPRTTDWATGAAMLIAMEAWRAVGPWDESYLLYSEETEYALRMGDHGWSIWYEPESVMEHIGGTDSVTDPRMFALLVHNRVKLYQRRHGRVAGFAFHAAVTVGEGLRAITGRRGARAAFMALLVPSRRLTALP
jgi:N-acetylglucosaminyl-diphospho-decaprenol L-rhamnosyltransferase